MAKKIMAWSKCAIEVGKTGTNDAMATTLTSVGLVKDKSATLESADGDSLEMKSTGGETVGSEKQEGTLTLACRIIEPGQEFYTLLGIGAASDTNIAVQSHVVPDEYSVKVTPNKVGAYGIQAPKCSVSVSAGWSEEDGNYVDLTFGILHGAQADSKGKSYWYMKVPSKGIVADTTNGGYKANVSA